MTLYLLRRLSLMVIVLFATITVTFFMLYLTGDPIAAILREAGTNQEQIAQIRREYGYNLPLIVQYGHFLAGLLHGNFGTSIQFGQPTLGLVLDRVPYTLELAAAAVVITAVLSIPLGLLSAVYVDTPVERTIAAPVALFQSVPSFVVGPILILVFAVNMRVFPVSGSSGPFALILPALTLALYPTAAVTRLLRASILDVLPADYVTTARAKGLREASILRRHVLRNALLPVLTVTGLMIAELLGGAVIVETIFGWPGIGQLSVAALLPSDFPLIRTVIILVATAVILINLVTDLVYTVVDPRIRLG
jgi:peptide/nickel transport system permease protein